MTNLFESARWREDGRVARGLLAGLVGGLVASWAMGQFQSMVPAETFKRLLGESDDESDDSGEDGSEPATVKVAEAVSEGALGHELTGEEKAWAGPTVHYAFGTANGTVYGVLAEVEPRVTFGSGLAFGAFVWLVADEGAVPASGLSAPPWTYPPSTHVYSLASHLVFGLTLEATRRLVRRLL